MARAEQSIAMTTGEELSDDPPEVYSLQSDCTIDDLEQNTPYLGRVNGVVPYGVFVDLNETISGLVHESNLHRQYTEGDDIVVTLEVIRENGDVAFEELLMEDYEVVPFSPDPVLTPLDDVDLEDPSVTIEGRVDQINQTAGPTIFTITDGRAVLPCAAFEAAGVRAYPRVENGDYVRVQGVLQSFDSGVQLEVDALNRLTDNERRRAQREVEETIDATATAEEIEPLVDWASLGSLIPDLEMLATTLRKAILESRPVYLRHHADVDGICAAVPIARALESFARRVHHDPNAATHLVVRSPSRAPYYEMEDAIRDLDRALEDQRKHGQRLPILVMLDNGSTGEDVPAYQNLAHYDIPIAVIDHHQPETSALGDLLLQHINPYLIGEDYRLTTGMIAVEVARMIDPDQTDQIKHLPAVAGIADRSAAEAMETYLAIAEEAGFGGDRPHRMADAIDFASHWLKYRPGSRLMPDLLGVSEIDDATFDSLLTQLATRAREAVSDQVAAVRPHVTTTTIDNGAELHQLDLDEYAHRFSYPAPGKTTGAIHDELVDSSGEPTITMGYGPDFCVLRSDGVRLDIPAMVETLQERFPEAGVSGGGHLVVGSLHFLPGHRATVLDELIEIMGSAEIDLDLGLGPTYSDPGDSL